MLEFGWYYPFPYAPTPCTIVDIIPLTKPGIIKDTNTPVLSKIPFWFIFFVDKECKIAQKKLVNVPIAIGYAELNIKSTLELNAIAPYE